MMKFCSKCKCEKAAWEFTSNGLRRWCKSCVSDYNLTYGRKNASRLKKYAATRFQTLKHSRENRIAAVGFVSSKVCGSCKAIKSVSEFWVSSHTGDGFHHWCKDCCRKNNKNRKAKNKLRLGANGQPSSKICTKCLIEKPKEEFSQSTTARDGLQYACKACKSEYARSHSAEIVAKVKAWTLANPQRYKDNYTATVHRRRAQKFGNGPTDRGITLRALRIRDQDICRICGLNGSAGRWSLDHILPLSKGGTHSWNNVQLSHLECNLRKAAKVT